MSEHVRPTLLHAVLFAIAAGVLAATIYLIGAR